jgi:serine/threonine protein kinase
MARFGRYEILGKIGEGAMGVVHRARDSSLDRVVALKMLSADLRADDELNHRFKREAEAIRRLDHPNIVSVYDVGETDGHLYMAMELLEGDDVRGLLERGADVPLADRVHILAQICDGLQYAHSKGVWHRDVKPANIFVTSAGRVKVLDFGLARVATLETITRRGIILGTPDYMSPEQAMGKTLDNRTDIFSAGAVFYEFLCREKPFRGRTLHGVLYQIISEEPDALLTVNPELPARLALVVHRMLRKSPDDRYASFEETGRELWRMHGALRRSHGRSAMPREGGVALEDEARARVRELVDRSRKHQESGQTEAAADELHAALAIDPDSREAAEGLWSTVRRRPSERRPEPQRSPEAEARIAALLQRARPGAPEVEAKKAIAELALVAPDDPRLGDLLRERSGRDR